MNTIQSRIDNSKLAAPIHPRQDASDMIAKAVAKFEKEGGSIYQAVNGETNFRSTTKKASDQKKERLAGVIFEAKKCAK